MEYDPQVLLSLLAVRLNGDSPSSKLDVFKKLKSYIDVAKQQNLLKEDTIEVSAIVKGKTKQKKEPVLVLTDLGRKYIESHGGEAAYAAAIAAQSTGAASQVRELQQQLLADRASLRSEVLASVNSKPKGIDPTKEISAIAKKMDELAKHFATLEAKLKPGNEGDILARIDDAFDKLEQRLQAKFSAASASQPIAPPRPHAPAQSLRSILREAYETLCLYIEFDGGVVELPRLYHEARKTVPDLTVHAFHQELESLWSQRVLELKVLNEVRSAKEQDKGIRRGDNLYYFRSSDKTGIWHAICASPPEW